MLGRGLEIERVGGGGVVVCFFFFVTQKKAYVSRVGREREREIMRELGLGLGLGLEIEIIGEAVEVEKAFICDALPVSLIGKRERDVAYTHVTLPTILLV